MLLFTYLREEGLRFRVGEFGGSLSQSDMDEANPAP